MGRLNVSLDIQHDVNLFGFVFGKMKFWINPCRENEILAYMLTSLINGKVNLSLNLKHDLWTYLVLSLVKLKYWNDPCRDNEILAYKVTKFDKWEGWTSHLI